MPSGGRAFICHREKLAGPFEISIQGSNAITIHDVLVGDIWVASGQSNMEFEMSNLSNAKEEIAAANYPKIRLFQAENKVSDYPLDNIAAQTWVECNPAAVAGFSAIAYFFGRNLQQKIGVPIGLIEATWGGTPAEAWTSLGAIAADASLMPVFAVREQMMNNQVTTLLEVAKEDHEFEEAAARAKAEGRPVPERPWHLDLQAWAPGALYNAMIAPLTLLPIRGVIWYQGESNDLPEQTSIYNHLFQTMIRDWRRAWGQGDFPFLFVQLANFKTLPPGAWPEIREAQRQALTLKNTAMAVTIDIGDPDDMHPKNKRDVGLRLALAARANAYGEKIEYSGPVFRQVTQEEHALRVWFDHAASGLIAKGGVLEGFEIAGADGKFMPAAARVEGVSVLVSSPSVISPAHVRYAWADNLVCNLYNGNGLPASPFRSSE